MSSAAVVPTLNAHLQVDPLFHPRGNSVSCIRHLEHQIRELAAEQMLFLSHHSQGAKAKFVNFCTNVSESTLLRENGKTFTEFHKIHSFIKKVRVTVFHLQTLLTVRTPTTKSKEEKILNICACMAPASLY